MIQELIRRWNDQGEDLFDLADLIIAESETAEEIAQLPYAIGNNCGSWEQVDRRTARACDKIAAAALERDPENEAALWLYTNEDFLRRVGRKGAPIPTPSVEQRIAKIERILELITEDRVHPLNVPSLETIVLDHAAVLDAMMHGFERAPEGHGRHSFIEALGGTLVDHQ